MAVAAAAIHAGVGDEWTMAMVMNPCRSTSLLFNASTHHDLSCKALAIHSQLAMIR
jgi:hypothetical protein